MAKWKDISTAPKDGTEILVCNGRGEIRVCHWGDISMGGRDMGWQYAVVSTDWNWYEYVSDATHWMELPELPSL